MIAAGAGRIAWQLRADVTAMTGIDVNAVDHSHGDDCAMADADASVISTRAARQSLRERAASARRSMEQEVATIGCRRAGAAASGVDLDGESTTGGRSRSESSGARRRRQLGSTVDDRRTTARARSVGIVGERSSVPIGRRARRSSCRLTDGARLLIAHQSWRRWSCERGVRHGAPRSAAAGAMRRPMVELLMPKSRDRTRRPHAHAAREIAHSGRRRGHHGRSQHGRLLRRYALAKVRRLASCSTATISSTPTFDQH